jgi:hypothetical protein
MFVACEIIKFFDSGLHVVAGESFPLVDGGKVDLILYRFVGRNGFV